MKKKTRTENVAGGAVKLAPSILAADFNQAGEHLKLHQPDWSDQSHSLAISAWATAANLDLYLMLNAYWEPLRFELPPAPEAGLRPWRRWLDTFLESPDDICLFSKAPPVASSSYLVHPAFYRCPGACR
jgi:isoamylase